jgi:ribose-phosphate pyrophosphokinase
MHMEAVLFHCPQMGQLAKKICAVNDKIHLGKIAWKNFEDGWPNIFVGKEEGIRQKRAAFLASFDTPADLFPQISVIYTLSRLGAKEIKVILPYYPTGTLERGDTESQVVTAKTLARILSATPLGRSGPVELVLYDIHSLGQRHYFGDNIVTRYKTGTKYLKERLKDEDVSIAFPDIGAHKRFKTMFDGSKKDDRKFPLVICDKVRDGNKRIVTVREGDVAGRHVVIVDDMIKSGGTLIECCKALLEHGAAKVSAFATHGSFPQESWKKFLNAGFAHVWVTDSCPKIAAKVEGTAPFEILSLNESLARVILDQDDRADDQIEE